MALPDVGFTNNLGTVTFKRCTLGVTDSWEWAGRGVKHVKSISVSGTVKQGGDGEKLDGILTQRGVAGKQAGDTGTLTLPWTTLTNVKLVGLRWGEGTWIDFVPVECTFVDETPYNNRYTFTLFGQTLYNPSVRVPVPTRPIIDEYPQQKLFPPGAFSPTDPRSGVYRTRAGERNMDVSLSGTIKVVDVALPTNFLQHLQMRSGFPMAISGPAMPGGHPQPFSLGDAVPELRDDLNLAHCIVVGGQVMWYVEQQQARVDLQLLAPPQKLGRS